MQCQGKRHFIRGHARAAITFSVQHSLGCVVAVVSFTQLESNENHRHDGQDICIVMEKFCIAPNENSVYVCYALKN